MEAKDTVLEGNSLLIYNVIVKCVECGRALERLEEPMPTLLTTISFGVDEIMAMQEAQAEISFKAGQDEGIKARKELDQITIDELRKAGIREGIRMYAWWKDGVQYVGTTGTTLKEALKEWGVEECLTT